MIPLVAYEAELRQLREHVVNVAEEARAEPRARSRTRSGR